VVVDLERKLILRDSESTEYDRHCFGKIFRKVRDAAAEKRHPHGNEALICPSIGAKNFQDLRDTARHSPHACWLHLARDRSHHRPRPREHNAHH
jgi:hypothetical protein